MTIGIAISTHNRPEMLAEALEHHRKYLPAGAHLLVLDDASEEPVQVPYWYTDVWRVRFDEPQGIAAIKNHAITALLYEQCDVIFLFDDDAWPIADGWEIPYISSGHDHLQASFPHRTKRSTPLHEVYRDDTIVAYHRSRGYMLYYSRRAIEAAGGMDTRFVLGHEHLEHSRRIHNLGVTLFPYADVINSDKLIYSADADPLESPGSSIDLLARRLATQSNVELFEETKDSTECLPYHPPRDVVLTCLLTMHADPQRPQEPQRADPTRLLTLTRSLDVHEVPWIVFYDDDRTIETNPPMAPLWYEETWADGWTKITTGVSSPYIQRWISYRQWLMDHPQVRNVWCVDGTDVELLRHDPFTDIVPGVLYCGWENEVCGKPWMLQYHESSYEWLISHQRDQLLSPGVIGGTRAVVMEFCDRLITARTTGLTQYEEDIAGDMGYANQAISLMKHETGPSVTSLFKGYEYTNTRSTWRHK